MQQDRGLVCARTVFGSLRPSGNIGCSSSATAPAAWACSLAMYSGSVATGAKVSSAAAESSVHSSRVFVAKIASISS